MRAPVIPARSSHSVSFSAISLYQTYISPADGHRCQMTPSCSHYTHTALKTKGIVKGILMGTDRIMRCGNDTKLYPKIWQEYRFYFIDAVDAPHESLNQ